MRPLVRGDGATGFDSGGAPLLLTTGEWTSPLVRGVGAGKGTHMIATESEPCRRWKLVTSTTRLPNLQNMLRTSFFTWPDSSSVTSVPPVSGPSSGAAAITHSCSKSKGVSVGFQQAPLGGFNWAQ
jgi:hypothetical protein